MTTPNPEPLDDRILIFAPVGKDAGLTHEVLARANLAGAICETASELCRELGRGAAAILLTEEALEDSSIGELMDRLNTQPAWSDIPILLFADAERSEVYLRTLRLLESLRNVVLLERPVRLGAVLSLIRSAIRARHRQYELRDLLRALAEAREEAEAANRLKDEFLATLSHELRTPLNAILGWTTMLRDGHVQAGHVPRALDTIYRNATAQVQIVNDLLDISRIVRGHMQIVSQTLPLAPVLEVAVESIGPAADANDLRVSLSCPEEPVMVSGDQDRLQQVFWNLLSNAVKFTPPGGRIDVEMRRQSEAAVVHVRDTGVGISPGFLPHVFDRFRQADGSSTRSHGGLGLGLSIVRHLVELHGGRLTAESNGEGTGAIFSVSLPLRQVQVHGGTRDQVGPNEMQPHAMPPLDLEDVHILIVDDDATVRERLRGMLAASGARLSEAGSADRALEIAAADRPDIVLADLPTPIQDGCAMIRAMRGLPQGRGRAIRALAVSAYARREDKQRAMAAGFDAHVAKPIHIDELYAALERVWTHGRRPAMNHTDGTAELH